MKKDIDFDKLRENYKNFLPLINKEIVCTPDQMLSDMGEGMMTFALSMAGWWKTRYLIDTKNQLASEFISAGQRLVNVDDEDIDWESVKDLDCIKRIKDRNAHFPTMIRGFHDGIAEVEWQIIPDGYYYRDSDGFGMEDEEEVTLFGYIDRVGNIVGRFTYLGVPWKRNYDILHNLRKEALKKAWKPE